MRASIAQVALASLGMIACSSTRGPSPTTDAATTTDSGVGPTATVRQHVAVGGDIYVCSYWAAPPAGTFLTGVSHAATAGTHHTLVFRTDLAAIPDGDPGAVDCIASPANPMAHSRGEIYGSQARAGSFAFPAGVGLPLAAGEVLLLQVHFVNASAQDIDARADVTFSTVTQGISTQAGVFFYEDPFIDIPAGAAGQASMRCIVPNDITILSVSSYGHARLQNLSAYIDAPSNPPAARPFFTSLGAANPLPIQASIPISAGSHVRVACAYQNEQGASDIFEGLDYRGDEMCVLSGTYYPVMSVAAESCALTPDEFGTGTSTCSQALACAVACPSATTPPADFGLLGTPQVDPCWQKCVAASCSATSALLFALERCSQANCSTACAAPASADCTTCQAAMCPSETSGCASDVCGG